MISEGWKEERQKVEDKGGESVTFSAGEKSGGGGASLLTLSPSCRTCRCSADRRFVWTVGGEGRGQAGNRGSERMLRTLKVSDSNVGLGGRSDSVIY